MDHQEAAAEDAAESSRSSLVAVSTGVHFTSTSPLHQLTNFSPGGKHFSKNLRPLDADGNELGMWGEGAEAAASSSEEESSEEESEEEAGDKPDLTREERRAAAKAKKEAAIAKKKNKVAQPGDMPSSSESEEDSDEEDMPANPNHSKAARNQASAPPVSVEEAAEGVKNLGVGGKGKPKPIGELSRREREAMQAQAAKERYQKLHEAGKTDEAKADMARLKLIREKRDAEAARKTVRISRPLLIWQLWHMLTACRPRRRSARSRRRPRRRISTRARRREERLPWGVARRRSRRSEAVSLFLGYSVEVMRRAPRSFMHLQQSLLQIPDTVVVTYWITICRVFSGVDYTYYMRFTARRVPPYNGVFWFMLMSI